MALFFKRIRQKLLIRKRFGKYSLYAVGEVLILVVGILFALQVNRWDQERIDKSVQLSILKTLKADLTKDLKSVQLDINLSKEVMSSSLIIQEYLERDLPYNDSLPYHFLTAFLVTHWMHNNGGIQSLKSLGVNTVTNEELRSKLIALYDYRYELMRYLNTAINNKYTFGEQHILLGRFDQAQYYDNYDTEVKWDGAMIPLDYESLKTDDEYLYYIKSFYNATAYYLVECDSTKNMITQVIENLEAEIKTFDN